MNNKVPMTNGTNGSISFSGWGVLAIVLGGAYLIRSGYELGVSQSRKILRRHDKDVRRMFKREKQYFKEQRKKEKETQKGGP